MEAATATSTRLASHSATAHVISSSSWEPEASLSSWPVSHSETLLPAATTFFSQSSQVNWILSLLHHHVFLSTGHGPSRRLGGSVDTSILSHFRLWIHASAACLALILLPAAHGSP